MSIEIRDHVITFYSYKGGTGRTMAMANVACLLAKQAKEKGVLMVDWDLEAPGLHRFFQDKFTKLFSETDDIDRIYDEKEGLIDLFYKLNEAITKTQNEDEASALLDSMNLEQFILETDIKSLYLLKAGRFDEKYAYRVNTFDWVDFYNRSPSIFRLFAERLTKHYQYVLIDSRTGITDISGICTNLMPDKLVVVFTPNRQSLTGLMDLIRQATKYRTQSDDLRPLAVFPLPSRIETAEPTLREYWRHGNQEKNLDGYQMLFENLFKDIYSIPECDLESYFNEVQIQHVPRYAYGEEIAVLVERFVDRLSLTRSYESFTKSLVNLAGPWEYVSAQKRTENGKYDVSDDIVLLTGGGASYYLGLPALDDLLKQAQLGNDEIADMIRRTRDVIEVQEDRFGKGVFGELIFRLKTYLDTTIMLRKDSVFREAVSLMPSDVNTEVFYQKWKKALTTCYRILLEEYGPKKIIVNIESSKKVEFQTTLKLLEKLAELNSGKLHIYTTNYDCSYQVLASHCKTMSFRTHIDTDRGDFTDFWYDTNPNIESSGLPLIYIHRLHGCVAWFTAGITVEPFGSGGNLEIQDDDYLHKMCIKLVDSQLTGINPVFVSAFNEFTKHLEKAKILFVWGSSFRDLEVLRTINNALSSRGDSLKIYYLNPYLRINAAIDNIQRTFLDAPILPATQFRNLVRIDWLPQDGHDKLTEAVIKTLREELNNA